MPLGLSVAWTWAGSEQAAAGSPESQPVTEARPVTGSVATTGRTTLALLPTVVCTGAAAPGIVAAETLGTTVTLPGIGAMRLAGERDDGGDRRAGHDLAVRERAGPRGRDRDGRQRVGGVGMVIVSVVAGRECRTSARRERCGSRGSRWPRRA